LAARHDSNWQTLPFANSASMLLWGLAASVPIIIHLWSKRRYHRFHWAAMEFLLAAVRKNARRIRLEHLILLLLRVAILVLLAVALADPVWSLLLRLGFAPFRGRFDASRVGSGRFVLDGVPGHASAAGSRSLGNWRLRS
jgi:hypothetical protein